MNKTHFEMMLSDSSIKFWEDKSTVLLEEIKRIMTDKLSNTAKCNHIREALNQYHNSK